MSVRRVIAAVLVACLAGQAIAHAFLDHAEPPVGSTVRPAPPELKLWFSQDLEPAFSTVRVHDATGRRVDNANSRVDPADRSLLRVSLQALGPGVYTVVWRVVSVDAHVTEGDFTFHVDR